MASAMSTKINMRATSRPSLARRPARAAVVKPVAALDPAVIVSGSTAAFLSLGRFVYLPYQRRSAEKADVGPKTDGATFFDDLQKPSSFVLTSKDPEGFNIIDVMGWGALGHAFGFAVLAAASLNSYGITPFPTP
mmetsp:Transcript_66196/g.145198  ORF Transcript_66196/g.145198 Transcript_66196/m.145198 type:complete len:135 (+) Transcript_66196:1-405(+)